MNNLDKNTKELVKGLKDGNDKALETALTAFQQATYERIKADFDEFTASQDKAVLAQRGYRSLTSEEKTFYEKFIEAAKASDYKQAIANIDVSFPDTTIEDVFKEITDTHPLLNRINFQSTTLVTKWVLSDASVTKATWGAINSAIVTEITGSLKEVDLGQNKLTAFALIPLDMLDMGATFIDKYIRALLAEGLATALEDGIINGDGNGKPIGLTRDIHEGVTVTGGAYPIKESVALDSFTPEDYGAVLATLAKTEQGNPRTFNQVQLIVNPVDYLTKIMPATTLLNANGAYVANVFPFPTEVIQSTSVAQGKAVLAVLPEYFMGVAASKSATIEYSDEFKYLEDMRTYKTKFYGNGRAYDNTCAVLLDISGISPAYLNVKEIATV